MQTDEGEVQSGEVADASPSDGTARYYTRHDDEDGSLSVTVAEALAEAKGVSPLDLENPLYETVDPDALDRLFVPTDSERPASRLVFETEGHEVTVHSDGHVYVRAID